MVLTAVVVADLCDALADLVEQSPGLAARTARQLGAELRNRRRP